MLIWDLPDDLVLLPGQSIRIEFTVLITNSDGQGMISNFVSVDYNDPCYTGGTAGRHPAVNSPPIEFPEEPIIPFPNPYGLGSARDGQLKFANVPPGSIITMFTISGEMVVTIDVPQVRAVWDGKNNHNHAVSPGVYFYLVKNMYSRQITKGKVFVVR
jgi:hypothetical protein